MSTEDKSAVTTMEVDESSSNSKRNENVTPSASGETTLKYPSMSLAQSIHKLSMMTATTTTKIQLEEKDAGIDIPSLRKKVRKEVRDVTENPSLLEHLQSTLHESLQMMQVTGIDTIAWRCTVPWRNFWQGMWKQLHLYSLSVLQHFCVWNFVCIKTLLSILYCPIFHTYHVQKSKKKFIDGPEILSVPFVSFRSRTGVFTKGAAFKLKTVRMEDTVL